MSETHHESRRDDVAAYLLGALEPDEAAELERHLAGCEECRAELRWLEPAAQILPEAVERHKPPAELRARILATARSEAKRTAPRVKRRPLFSGWRPLAALGALALVLAAVGGYAIRGGGEHGGQATTMTAGRPPGVTAQMVREGDAATLHLANVGELRSGRVLEAWVQRNGEVRPVSGLFVPDRGGRATTMIPDLRGVEVVMVTAEPRGGSEHPTTTPMVTLRMSQS
ncbi:MAG: anti-sigma factor domain-containing protein [Solirubrobacterales bacterium]